jgi:hypothetical protein
MAELAFGFLAQGLAKITEKTWQDSQGVQPLVCWGC